MGLAYGARVMGRIGHASARSVSAAPISGEHSNPDMTVFKNQLYASAGWGDGRGQMWRTADGTTWTPVEGDGFGADSDKHTDGVG